MKKEILILLNVFYLIYSQTNDQIKQAKNLIKNSEEKLKDKRCDLIVANDVSKKDFGFDSEYNKVTLIEENGVILNIKKSKKKFIAATVAKKILDKFLFVEKYIN